MRVKASDGYMIFLNKKPMKGAVEASEEEGWVDILDLSSANLPTVDLNSRNIDTEKVEIDNVDEVEVIPTKRLFGEVKVLPFLILSKKE